MNEKLEAMLREDFLAWRAEMLELERQITKGLITYREWIEKSHDNDRYYADSFFDCIHGNCNW